MGHSPFQMEWKSNQKQTHKREKPVKDNMLEIFAKLMTAERFDQIVSEEKEYIKRDQTVEELVEQVRRCRLTREQRLAVDRLLAANNMCNYRYSELAYMQGIKDCVSLLKEMDLIKT